MHFFIFKINLIFWEFHCSKNREPFITNSLPVYLFVYPSVYLFAYPFLDLSNFQFKNHDFRLIWLELDGNISYENIMTGVDPTKLCFFSISPFLQFSFVTFLHKLTWAWKYSYFTVVKKLAHCDCVFNTATTVHFSTVFRNWN